jgi:alpha-D-ribose 1-methylphosphonate 5-triphosphate diphosphatase
MRRAFRALGARLCEFPVNAATAACARERRRTGHPGRANALSGWSLLRPAQAGAALADGLCTALASDYFYPSLLARALPPAADGVLDFAAPGRRLRPVRPRPGP